jgi:hypothetical protein
MALIHEIQETLLSDEGSLARALLKMRFLASRLGSETLEEWVKYEAEGYPNEVELPGYRKFPARYFGTFTGGFGREIRNAPIPTPLVCQIAGESWDNFPCRDSVKGVEAMIGANAKDLTVTFDASNLIILLQGYVYEGMACNSVRGQFAMSKPLTLLETVRTRLLELCLELEAKVPGAVEISVGTKMDEEVKKQAPIVSYIASQVVHGNLTQITNSGDHAVINVTVEKGSPESVVDMLRSQGLPEDDATTFAEILASESPTNSDTFGEKAKGWISENIGKAMNGAWKIALPVATQVLTAAAERFYGLT